MTILRMAALCLALALPVAVAAPPIARFETVLGQFEVLLEPSSAPRSVSNFVTYANRGDYDSTIIHRSTTYNPLIIQIVQGGGFQLVTNTITAFRQRRRTPLDAPFDQHTRQGGAHRRLGRPVDRYFLEQHRRNFHRHERAVCRRLLPRHHRVEASP